VLIHPPLQKVKEFDKCSENLAKSCVQRLCMYEDDGSAGNLMHVIAYPRMPEQHCSSYELQKRNQQMHAEAFSAETYKRDKSSK
jgi:hypothetical protein